MRIRSLAAVAMLVLSAMVATGQDRGTAVYYPGNDVSTPKIIKEVKATYTPEARAAKIEGTVWVEVVVQPDGTPIDLLLNNDHIRLVPSWPTSVFRTQMTHRIVRHEATESNLPARRLALTRSSWSTACSN
jgi:hypothetical protein